MKKLKLKKETIALLDNNQMKQVDGGVCPTTVNNCKKQGPAPAGTNIAPCANYTLGRCGNTSPTAFPPSPFPLPFPIPA